MTAIILNILSSNATLLTELIKSQTPAQQLVLWDRYIDFTQPLHNLLMKLEGLVPMPEAAAAVTK